MGQRDAPSVASSALISRSLPATALPTVIPTAYSA
jgi:hypothetical protein